MAAPGPRKMLRALAVLPALACAIAAAGQQPPAGDKSPTGVLNENLPKWIRFSGEYRARFEGFTGGGFKPGNDDEYLLSRLRLNLKLQATPWLKFTFQGQDAHALGKDQHPAVAPYQDTMDLRLGFVEIGDAEKKPVSLRLGRQELAFGEERLIGNVDWTNTARSFDGMRATFRHDGYRLDAFAASVVKSRDGQFNEPITGNYLYGLYGGLARLVPNATVEPYFLWRRASGTATELGARAVLNFGTTGFRWVGKLPANFDYGSDTARQQGSVGAESVGAWAGHWVLGRTLPTARFKPRFSLEYNYASGDHNARDGKHGTFDSLYPTGHDKYGLADQVGWKNIRNARAGAELKVNGKCTLTGRYDAWWLADPHDALYDAAGNVQFKVASGTAGRFVGQEADVIAVYSVSKQVRAGGGYGHIFPGTFLNHASKGASYNYPYVMVNYAF
jgi:hypothetical protein